MAIDIASPGTKSTKLKAALLPLTQKVALSRTTTLPGSPTDGDIYIVPSGADANKVALRSEGAWIYHAPVKGWTFYVADTGENVQFDGSAWNPAASGGATKVALSFFARSKLDASDILFRHKVARAFTLPAGLLGSVVDAAEAATASTALTVRKNGTSVGTATFAASGTTATLAMASATSFAKDDVLSITGPATADATLADVSGTILGDLV